MTYNNVYFDQGERKLKQVLKSSILRNLERAN